MNDAPRRRAASLATRTDLLEGAKRLFLDRGYEDTTVRKIAAEASVTMGAFYGHFDSKRTVLFEVVRSMNVAGRRRPFQRDDERSLVLTVASFAHADPTAAVVLGEVLRGPGRAEGATVDRSLAGEMLANVAR